MAYYYSVKQGNLLREQNATFIVNASNTRLMVGRIFFEIRCLKVGSLKSYKVSDGAILRSHLSATNEAEL